MKVAVAYPSSPSIANLSLSFKLIQSKLEEAGFDVDGISMNGVPPKSHRRGAPLSAFDAIIFTLHYELDYINMVKMLAYSKVPARSSRRSSPFVVVGGPPVMANPEPIADFVDVVTLGDLEAVLPSLIGGLTEGPESLSEVDGFYAPSLGKREIHGVYVKDISDSPFIVSRVDASLFGSDVMVEAMRGCPHGCLFCMESYISKPPRFGDLSRAADLVKASGARRVALIGLSVGDHPALRGFIKELMDAGISISYPSLRADTLDCGLIRMIAKSGQRTLTVAPESSERLRSALGKGFSDSDLLRIAKCSFEAGIRRIKLYFMVGLPGELDHDVRQVRELSLAVSGLGPTYISVNPWMPKPHTPLQWFPMQRLDELRRRIEAVVKGFGESSYYDPIHASVQALLSLGDRDVSRFIVDAARVGKDKLDKGDYRRLINSHSDLLEKYVYAARKPGDPLPWSHIKVNDEELLGRLYEQYVERIQSQRIQLGLG